MSISSALSDSHVENLKSILFTKIIKKIYIENLLNINNEIEEVIFWS